MRSRAFCVLSDGERTTSIEKVKITTRGHTSLRESECSFPKLKLDFAGSRVEGTLFDGVSALKIGTHCSDKPDAPGGKYGRWPNEKTAHREAFVYRLLETMAIPSLKARPARLTYVESGSGKPAPEPLVRDAMLLEDDSEALKRYGARSELSPKQFGSAPSVFAMPDLAKLFFAEAMIGNFDWCLRMSPRDMYRCNPTTPIWNILGLIRSEGTGRSGPARFRSRRHGHDPAHLVQQGLQPGGRRHRSGRRSARAGAADAIGLPARSARRDARCTAWTKSGGVSGARRRARWTRPAGRRRRAISTRSSRPSRPTHRSIVRCSWRGRRCGPTRRPRVPRATEEAPPGTPVSAPLDTAGDKSRVVVLDALWQWAEKCEAVRLNPVWVPTAAISENYPTR